MNWLRKYRIDVFSILLLLLLLGLFTVTHKNEMFIFDWDQGSDYESVQKIVEEKNLTLIGPRVTSDTGFFLGPWHYYFLAPFFLITKGSLYMGFWAAFLIQFLFASLAYFFVKKEFGTIAGLSTGILLATPIHLLAWGFMYIPVLAIIFFGLCLKTLDNPKLLPLVFLFFGFGCTTYAVFYCLGIPLILITIKCLYERKTSIKKLIMSGLLFLVPYLPMFIFDIRHNFLNLRNMFGLFANQNGNEKTTLYFLQVFQRAVNYSLFSVNLSSPLSTFLFYSILLILIIGILTLFPKKKIFVFVWILAPLIMLSFYKGNVSEYYYGTTTILVPIFLAGVLSKRGLFGKIILGLTVSLIISLRIAEINNNKSRTSLGVKMEIVNILDKTGIPYSVSYDLKLGQDGGYNTILAKMGKNYVSDGSAQLYTITYDNHTISGTKIATVKKMAIYKR
jgi:hypothetical protein